MAKSITSDARTESLKEANRPVACVEVYLGDQTTIDDDTLLFAATNQDIVSGSQTYTASGLSVDSVQKDLTGRINSFSLGFPNVRDASGNYPISQYVLNNDLRGKRVRIFKIFQDLPNDQITIFDGYTEAITNINEVFVAALVSQRTNFLTVQLPRHTYEEKCPWRFASGASDPCNYNPSGGVGNNDPSTGLPFATCNKSHSACVARGMTSRFRGIPFK